MVNVWLFVTHVRQTGSDSLEAPRRSHYNINAQMQTFDCCL